MLGFRRLMIASALLMQLAVGCGGDDGGGDANDEGAPAKPTETTDGGSAKPSETADASTAKPTVDASAPGKGDTATGATIGKKVDDKVKLGELSAADQKQYCIDVKRHFAPLREEAIKTVCTRVAAGQTKTVEECVARRDECIAEELGYSTDPGCSKGKLLCMGEEGVRVNTLSACFVALGKTFQSYAAKQTTCDPKVDKKRIPTPPECEVTEVYVHCSAAVDGAIGSAKELW